MRTIFSHVPRENGFPQRPEAAIVRPKGGVAGAALGMRMVRAKQAAAPPSNAKVHLTVQKAKQSLWRLKEATEVKNVVVDKASTSPYL